MCTYCSAILEVISICLQICEEQDGVEILCEQKLNIYEEEKNATFLWSFEVRTKVKFLCIQYQGIFKNVFRAVCVVKLK